MRRVIETGKVPVKLWTNEVEPGAMEQIMNLANYPFAFHHIAIMPDCHEGFGMPIGGVMATRGVIVPNAVGVDIGCGMIAVKTSLAGIERKILETVTREIRSVIPLGFEHHKKSQDIKYMPDLPVADLPVVRREYESARHQVGTLGGGNHFIEIQQGNDGHLWVMIHSGSRNLGKQVADEYNRLAKALNKKENIKNTWEKQLAYLYTDSEEGQRYIREMEYCVAFAFANRSLMMDTVLGILDFMVKGPVEETDRVAIAHNFAALEKHFGQEIWVHRKGATPAFKGMRGIIPGSQGTESYIVMGKGNEESFSSCSHGAGRVLGRRQAVRHLNLQNEVERLEKKGIIHSIRRQKDLDEAPSAYKDIHRVIRLQEDLVDVLVELQPLAVVKG
ncbi:MAG TPA: RtcB family protein [Bacteroidetes bacterium]|nr:RtcB family protein [Bacteroidota bacterium]